MFFLLGTLILNPSPGAAQTTARPQKADLPPPDEIRLWGALQDSRSEWRYLKGAAKIETSDFDLTADEIDYNSDTHWAYARGHVHLEHFATGDKLDAAHGEYNLKTQDGTFYAVEGTSPSKVMARPGILTTTNPFYFQARWAERIKNRYILHRGYVTDCKIPKPWWTFEAPVFDIIPADRAIARHTIFRVKRVPVLYLPYFYRPLGRNPRASGFLTPNIGHSSIYGWMTGVGYYWAMNRSYDMTGILHYFSERGPAVRYNFRGKPNDVTDFSLNLYGVKDRGVTPPGSTVIEKEGGLEVNLTARTQIWGFQGVMDYTYLSSYLFRAAFFYSPSSTIWSQNNSIGFLQRHYNDDLYALNLVLERDQTFNSITYQNQLPNQVIVQKLPSIEFSGRDQEIGGGSVPLWFSFGSTAGMLNREEPLVETNGAPTAAQIFHTGQIGRI
ncbi:MAG: LPS-assembly protein LptD, partial [Acidobacteriales bacterium]|nr:LPS-assembly protein LptD [Terriglobales bacterium]